MSAAIFRIDPRNDPRSAVIRIMPSRVAIWLSLVGVGIQQIGERGKISPIHQLSESGQVNHPDVEGSDGSEDDFDSSKLHSSSAIETMKEACESGPNTAKGRILRSLAMAAMSASISS